MVTLRRIISAHPLVWFVIAAYAFSWWSVPFANGAIIPYGPFIAAVIILALTKGRAGLRELFHRMTSWQGGLIWLLIAPGLVILYLALAFAINLLLGASVSQTEHLRSFGPTFLNLLLLGGLWEEPGWTGFALPMLQMRNASHRFGFLRASLISWLFNSTGESVIIPMLFHFTSNVVGGRHHGSAIHRSLTWPLLHSLRRLGLAAGSSAQLAAELEYGPPRFIIDRDLTSAAVDWLRLRLAGYWALLAGGCVQ